MVRRARSSPGSNGPLRIPYGIEMDDLRRRFSTIGWRTFADWARVQDSSIATSPVPS